MSEKTSQIGTKIWQFSTKSDSMNYGCDYVSKPFSVQVVQVTVPRKGFKRKTGSNLTLDEIKKRILIKLYEKREGLNQNKIRALPTLNATDWNDLSSILAELCVVGKLNADPASDYKEGSWIYTIIDDGREFVEVWKKMRGIGIGFSFFNVND